MKREKLETYIGRQVKVLLFDGRAYEGCPQKTNTDAAKHNHNLYKDKWMRYMETEAINEYRI